MKRDSMKHFRRWWLAPATVQRSVHTVPTPIKMMGGQSRQRSSMKYKSCSPFGPSSSPFDSGLQPFAPSLPFQGHHIAVMPQ